MEALSLTRQVIADLSKVGSGPAPRVRLWDGTEVGDPNASSTLVLNHPGALRALLLPPTDLTAGEAYIYDDVDIEGDMESMLRFAAGFESARLTPSTLRLLRQVRRLPEDSRRSGAGRPRRRGRLHTLRRDRQAVRHHYDTGNDFFALFLDEAMVYSCAYFLDPTESLEVAQRRKLDVVCRKLQLQSGQRLLDVGCGWGAMVIHAARHFGVEAVGVTLSTSQADLARKRVAEAGLTDRVEILELDYRQVVARHGRHAFDAISSIGMFEHVGRSQLETYFGHLRDLLRPGGAVLNHGITTTARPSWGRRKPTFVNTYVFPDGELVPIDAVLAAAGSVGFEIRDVEALRRHYAVTLREWVRRLEDARAEAVELAGETAYRIWRAYMAGSVIGFESNGLGLFQVLMADPDRAWSWGRGYTAPVS